MSNPNGHNPFDAITARIVAGAIEADKLPPAAAKAVRRALNLADARPPARDPEALDVRIDPNEPPQQRMTHLIPGDVGIDPRARLERLAGERIAQQQDAIVQALARERSQEACVTFGGRIEGFDYMPTTTAPGYREYELDGAPLIRFWSPEVAFDGDFMLVNLRYRVPT